MNKPLIFILSFCILSQWSFGQGAVVMNDGEVLSPLRVNANAPKFQSDPYFALSKSPGTEFYFILDTLTLPFIDDFSTYNIKSYDTLTYNQSFVKDSLSFAFTVDGIPMDSFFCVSDTTWSYLFMDSIVPTLSSKTPLVEYEIIYFNDENNPFVPTDTTYCWSPFEVYDTLSQFTPDTLDSIGIEIDTLLNVLDTLKVYPPDTISGGGSLTLWIDEHTFINNRYPVDPPTIGVATFDGLNEFGQPYNAFVDPLGYGVADYLTSKPIDLSYLITDSVYISFYYQAEGIGNNPQDEDSLVLEFYAPLTRTWSHVWSVPGKSLHDFKHVIQQVTNLDHLQNGFQFRFKNYATISGAFDHWHVDYVRIDAGRNDVDSVITDAAIVTATRSVLQNFESVPWKHYLADTTLSLDTPMAVHMHNLFDDLNKTGYKYSIKHNDGLIDSTLILPTGTNTNDLTPFSEFSKTTALNYFFNWSSETDSAVFEITSFILPNKNDIFENDTLKYYQRFYNYYAYDDGTAEGSYGLNAAGAKLGYEFTTTMSDTLRAIDMYFAQSKYDQSDEFFYLTVWSSLSPEIIVYQQPFQTPEYEENLNEFHTYILNEIVEVSGTFYIGWVQETDAELGIGIDFNRDVDNKRFYNTSGTWLQSLLGGAIMMRPLFGDTVVLQVGVEEQQSTIIESSANFSIYPNPANDVIHFDIHDHGTKSGDFEVSIIDLYGRVVISESNSTGVVEVKHLSDGIYFVKVGRVGSMKFETKKIFISH